MKKTLLAAALMVGFAGAAHAETSVTMYGILDTGYGYSQVKYDKNDVRITGTSSGLTSGVVSGNRWGVRGSEDLGDGLRAVFNLEAGFDLGTGATSNTGRLFHRQAWLGLASDNWGTFTMGRQYNLAYNGFTHDVNEGVSMGDMDRAFGGSGSSNRIDNSFKYVTPSFSGFKAGIAYGNPSTTIERVETAGVTTSLGGERSNWLSTGLKYESGPLFVAASYDRASSTLDKATTNWAIAGSYDFEVVKLSLAYGQDRHGKLGWQNAASDFYGSTYRPLIGAYALGNDFKSSNYYVGLSAPVGTGTLAATWNRSSSNLDDADKWGDRAKAQNIYHLNYSYPLSKRTKVYAYGSYGTGIAYIDGVKAKEAGVGLNHRF